MSVGLDLGLVFVHLFSFSILCVFSFHLRVFCSYVVSFCYVRFSLLRQEIG